MTVFKGDPWYPGERVIHWVIGAVVLGLVVGLVVRVIAYGVMR